MRFGDDRSEAAAAKMAARVRNETEGAWAITAFSDFDESVMRRRSEDARGRFVIKIGRALIAEWNNRERSRIGFRIADRKNFVDLAGAYECVDFRHLGLQLVAVTLD